MDKIPRKPRVGKDALFATAVATLGVVASGDALAKVADTVSIEQPETVQKLPSVTVSWEEQRQRSGVEGQKKLLIERQKQHSILFNELRDKQRAVEETIERDPEYLTHMSSILSDIPEERHNTLTERISTLLLGHTQAEEHFEDISLVYQRDESDTHRAQLYEATIRAINATNDVLNFLKTTGREGVMIFELVVGTKVMNTPRTELVPSEEK